MPIQTSTFDRDFSHGFLSRQHFFQPEVTPDTACSSFMKMKISTLKILVPIACLLTAPLPVLAQAGHSGGSQTATRLNPVTNVGEPQRGAPAFNLPLKWNERGTGLLTAPLKNESKQPLYVLGVQATRGIFVVEFPLVVEPTMEREITFVYEAADNTDGKIDLIRVMTDQGLREILVNLDREKAVQLSANSIKWIQGRALLPQSVDLIVEPDTVVPQRVKVIGDGNKADLLNLGQGRYRIVVTPGSTAKVNGFPVFIEYEPALPGAAAVIYCEVTSAD